MNERRISYVYSFKCEEDLEHFKKLPDAMQKDIESNIAKVICESFVTPADEDYITARFLAQKGMHRAFFWAAAQALEKYLKAFLLMRGVSVNEDRFKGHPVQALHFEACKLDDQLSSINTKPHSSIKIHPNVAKSIELFDANVLLNGIETQGTPDNRYNSFGVIYNTGYLFALDSYIFGLRQKIDAPSIQETLRKMDQDLVDSFNFYNPWFAPEDAEFPELPNEQFNMRLSSTVTTLDFLMGPHAPHGSGLVLQWLNKKMKLPRKVTHSLKQRH